MNHTPVSPATITIKGHVCLATNPTVLPKKLKMTPTTLPTMAGNDSTAFPASRLSASANLFSHLFKTSSSLRGEPPTPPPPPSPPKSSVTKSAIVAILAKKAVSVEIIITICSRYEFFLAKMYFYQERFQESV